jgi:hypothetical protein
MWGDSGSRKMEDYLLAHPEIFLIYTKPAEIKNINLKIVRSMVHREVSLVVVTSNLPAQILEHYYKNNDIATENIWFIDTVSKITGGAPQHNSPNMTFINHPSDLTSLGIIISQMKPEEGKQTFVVVDSINSFLVHCESGRFLNFMQFFANRLRITRTGGIFLAIEGGLEPIIKSHIEMFADSVVESAVIFK